MTPLGAEESQSKAPLPLEHSLAKNGSRGERAIQQRYPYILWIRRTELRSLGLVMQLVRNWPKTDLAAGALQGFCVGRIRTSLIKDWGGWVTSIATTSATSSG